MTTTTSEVTVSHTTSNVGGEITSTILILVHSRRGGAPRGYTGLVLTPDEAHDVARAILAECVSVEAARLASEED